MQFCITQTAHAMLFMRHFDEQLTCDEVLFIPLDDFPHAVVMLFLFLPRAFTRAGIAVVPVQGVPSFDLARHAGLFLSCS